MANRLTKYADPSMEMSLPSKDPRNLLGYYQWANVPIAEEGPYKGALEHPLRRAGFNPYYDVFVPPSYDPLNMGSRSRMWGATLPSGTRWSEAREKLRGSGGLDEKAAGAIYKFLSEGELDEDRRSDLRYSDQTAYFNEAVRSEDRPMTIGHESTHRAISKLSDEIWGPGYMDMKTNMLLTRVMDYKYGDKQAREKAVDWIKHLSPDKTLEGGINYALPLIDELVEAIK